MPFFYNARSLVDFIYWVEAYPEASSLGSQYIYSPLSSFFFFPAASLT